jgi:nucleoside-diphosphate-sugar epimerase
MVMSLHVVVGAGPIGSTVARLLADAGQRVRVVTRGGGGPTHPTIERVAADATDAAGLTELTRGAAALYNCANPPYHRWAELWPPLAAALLATAEATGAVLATMGNLYGYGPVDGPMSETTPLAATSVKGRIRARMWQDALAAHAAGRARVTEARASDYLGPGARSMVSEFLLPAVRAGRPVRLPVDFDVPHTVTYTGDAARTLVAIARDERAWGQPWHVPSDQPTTMRAMAERAAALLGAPVPRLRRVPRWQVALAGLFVRELREFGEVAYQFDRPFVMDSTRARTTFDLAATPLDEALRYTLGLLSDVAGPVAGPPPPAPPAA